MGVDIKFDFSFSTMIMPKSIVHISFTKGNFKVMWTKPAGKRKILYSDNRLDAVVQHPRLLFVSDGISLAVYAIENKPITEKTVLFLAPYDNLGTGNLCFGNVERPKSIRNIKEFIQQMERAFTFGTFTHSQYLKEWQERAKTGTKVDVVLTCKKHLTIKQLL